jgi:hypothetical protein
VADGEVSSFNGVPSGHKPECPRFR